MYDSTGLPVKTNDIVSTETTMMALINIIINESVISPVVTYLAMKIPIV